MSILKKKKNKLQLDTYIIYYHTKNVTNKPIFIKDFNKDFSKVVTSMGPIKRRKAKQHFTEMKVFSNKVSCYIYKYF